MDTQKAGPASEALAAIRVIVNSPGKSYRSANDLLAVVVPLVHDHHGVISITEHIAYMAQYSRKFVAALHVYGDTAEAENYIYPSVADDFGDRTGAFARMQALYALFATASLDDIEEESPATPNLIT